ncbi:AbiH family protein [Sphingobacterium deserti]|uniref:Bacteriophage abortive infection AbiH n=1 Tax=Sphingobacterium deserti TaxID=1229276 RepID=A0A0B8T7U4_9SPHI|nr:AbiH family protein [Sphingobacterium deserti]KGE14629.1 hypothetical protein DI53_1658 [Sphingobacterium deserti]
MNKLIIVGNGFDLHHKLPTQYSDFVNWFFEQEFKNAIEAGSRINSFFTIKCTEINSTNGAVRIDSISELRTLVPKMLPERGGLPNIEIRINDAVYLFNFEYTSDFFSAISTHYENMKWVDIEMIYYRKLSECLALYRDHRYKFDNTIKKLNEDLSSLKDLLCEYLSIVSNIREIDYNFNYCAEKPVDKNSIVDKHHLEGLNRDQFEDGGDRYIIPKSVTFLNFNYTGLTYKLTRNSSFRTIDIHGRLHSKENAPIFGYGDEIDEEYFLMEKTNENDFLTHIKSFGYFANNNYSDLVNILESGSYIVYVWGHSCGLSDRTLLNMIFEHDNCAAIQPFYWQKDRFTDDYIQITQNISRHFKDKKKMRNRLLNKKFCSPLGSQ